jgi:hypothetical protein
MCIPEIVIVTIQMSHVPRQGAGTNYKEIQMRFISEQRFTD